MLSYQHAYHAGNRADVHKHLALVMLLRSLQRKTSPLCYVDAHAGSGIYDLGGEQATKTNEAADGILRLAAMHDPPAPVRDYLDVIARFNPDGVLRHYPGSPVIAHALLREPDRAVLLELHPQEIAALRRAVTGHERVSVHARDCYEGLPALLPPPIRRGLVLIDPSYEIKTEYEAVPELLGRALARWRTGVYLVWYPLLGEARHLRMLDRVTALAPPKTLVSELRFAAGTRGLQGSGLIVVNTPWQFGEAFEQAMQYVTVALRRDEPLRHEQRWLTAP